MKKVLVCGSRVWDEYAPIFEALNGVAEEFAEPLIVITGAARGADSIALSLARSRDGWWAWPCPANWGAHGKPAGPRRNQAMLEYARPDIVLAFMCGESKGTRDMVERAKKAGLIVRVDKR